MSPRAWGFALLFSAVAWGLLTLAARAGIAAVRGLG